MDVSPRCSRRYSASSKSQVNQLQPARHLPGNTLGVIKSAADRGNVGRGKSNCRPNKIVVTKNAVGGVESNPAGAGKKNFRPGVEGTFGALGFGIAFPQVTTR